MLKTIKTAALSALIGIAALGTVVPASAQSGVYLGLGGGHRSPEVGVWLGDAGGRSYRRHDDRRYSYRRVCSPEQAVNKARRMGVRNAHVRDVNRNSIRVAGRDRGDRVVLRFAREPGCPVIGGRW